MSSALESDRRKSTTSCFVVVFFTHLNASIISALSQINFRSKKFPFRLINRDSTAPYLAILTIILNDVPFSRLRKLKHHDRSLIADMHAIRKDTSAKTEFRVWLFAVAI